MLKAIHTYDLDGVLVDSSHRYRNKSDGTIDLDYWIANRVPEKIALDKLLPHSWQYVDDILNPSIYVIICTSRVWTAIDQEFIDKELGQPDVLLMRPVGNTQADATLKRRQLQRIFNLRQFKGLPRILWEDNLRNIEALRDLFDKRIYIISKQGA